MIDGANNDYNSTIYMIQAKLNELKIYKGDPVLIRG